MQKTIKKAAETHVSTNKQNKQNKAKQIKQTLNTVALAN